MYYKTFFAGLLVLVSVTTLSAQQLREIIRTPRNEHSIFTINGVAKLDNEARPFTGRFIETDNDGKKQSLYTYANGILEGPYFRWRTRDGIEYIHEQGSYKAGKLNGPYLEMVRPNHKLKEATYVNGELNGKYTMYWGFNVEEPEIIRFYKLGKDDSTHTRFFRGGKIASIQRSKNGLRHGKHVYYYENGQLESETTFVLDKRTGVAKRYYENGQLSSSSTYLNGELNGEELYYYPSGKIKERHNYKLGNKYGKFIWYKEDGTIEEQANYGL